MYSRNTKTIPVLSEDSRDEYAEIAADREGRPPTESLPAEALGRKPPGYRFRKKEPRGRRYRSGLREAPSL
jgi:hypothetical protein